MFGKMENATMINTSKPLWPTFPIKCVVCDATHDGDLTQAINDGWHIVVYDTQTEGQVQFAGCPLHTSEWEGEGLAFLKKHSQTKKEDKRPKVLNKRTDQIPADAIYVGRPSKWGNPFRLNDPLLYGYPKEEKRRLVIDEYRKWLQGDTSLIKECGEPPNPLELKGKNLVCWCAPLPCHADVLIELANA